MKRPPILFLSAFPLQIKYNMGNTYWEIWTNTDDKPGSLNNFVVCEGFHTYSEAEFFLNAVNREIKGLTSQ
jgi:hypothetical protein